MQRAKLVVPYDAYPGKMIQINLQGRDFMVQIPVNARPGQEILIQVPVAQQQPAVNQYGYPIVPPPLQNTGYPHGRHHHHHHSPPPPQQQQSYAPPPAQRAYPPPPPAQRAYPPPPPAQRAYVPVASYAPPVPPPPPPADYGRQVYLQAITPSQKPKLRVTANHVITPENAAAYAEFNILSVYEGETVFLLDGDLVQGLSAPYDAYVEVECSDGRYGKVAKSVLQRI